MIGFNDWRMKLTGVLLLATVSIGTGWKLAQPSSDIGGGGGISKDTEQVVVEEKRPDGTIIRRVENRSNTTNIRRDWTASAYLIPRWDDPTNPSFAFGAGRRILDTNAWAVAEYVHEGNIIMIGVRLDF